jgi:hypothetical protein
MKIRTKALIRGMSNSWKGTGPPDSPVSAPDREVVLEILGDAKNGYHLNMSPWGCFTADTWHATLEEAKDTAHRIFDVPLEAWSGK